MEDTPTTNISGDAHQEMIAAFLEITSATKEEASFFLELHKFDLDSAVSTFFEAAAAKKETLVVYIGSLSTGRIQTFSDLNRQGDNTGSDSDKPQEYYTGGEKR
ncbi:unnamed protein product [Lactuca saligna]|uniref:Uncharacterized protein n=1 Tax=Lactuca saligna TaxID=75948 RepID=A0AA35ZLN1_LACSI|nr:unnamed protein product [Lactuca saligna]